MVDLALGQVVAVERMMLNMKARMGSVMVVSTVIVAFAGLG